MSRKAFILIGLFWLLIIAGLVGGKEYTLSTGQDVLLRTVPIDPRDLFRGDYVILNYEISRLDISGLTTDIENPIRSVGRNVYVALDIEDGHGRATGVFAMKPPGLFIRGKIRSLTESGIMTPGYGIESFFVPEGAGKVIERLRQDGFDVRVSIDRFGNAVIKSLVIDGEDVSF